jgi:hypothetical protein
MACRGTALLFTLLFTYGNLEREKLWQILRQEGILTQLLKTTDGIYQNSKISVKYNDGQISGPINVNK